MARSRALTPIELAPLAPVVGTTATVVGVGATGTGADSKGCVGTALEMVLLEPAQAVV